jgi:uncharacterized protein
MKWLLTKVLLGLITIYKNLISPLLMPSCRYYPTCSEYGMEAIGKYGPFKGGWLTLKRILRCNPGEVMVMIRYPEHNTCRPSYIVINVTVTDLIPVWQYQL